MATDVQRIPEFRERFAKLRGKRTQKEFADYLGIARPTVGFYENGDRIPDAAALKKICSVCGVTSDYLLGLSDYENQDVIDKLMERVKELDGLDSKQKSYLLWSLGFVSERVKYVQNAELRDKIIAWLAGLIQSYAQMVYLPHRIELTSLAVLASSHRTAINLLSELDGAIVEELFNQNSQATHGEGETNA